MHGRCFVCCAAHGSRIITVSNRTRTVDGNSPIRTVPHIQVKANYIIASRERMFFFLMSCKHDSNVILHEFVAFLSLCGTTRHVYGRCMGKRRSYQCAQSCLRFVCNSSIMHDRIRRIFWRCKCYISRLRVPVGVRQPTKVTKQNYCKRGQPSHKGVQMRTNPLNMYRFTSSSAHTDKCTPKNRFASR